jgi:hypothetical protein
MAYEIDDNDDLEVCICKGDYSHLGSAEVGVKMTHKETGITVYSLSEKITAC